MKRIGPMNFLRMQPLFASLWLCSTAAAQSVPLAFQLDPPEPKIGQALLLRIPVEALCRHVACGPDLLQGAGLPEGLKGSFRGQQVAFFRAGEAAYALLGSSMRTRPGTYLFHLELPRKNTLQRFQIPVPLKADTFPVQRLRVDRRFENICQADRDRVFRGQAAVDFALAHLTRDPLWRKSFFGPVNLKGITAPFGEQRVFNSRVSSVHRGVDFYGQLDESVTAINDGRVILTGDFFYSGKSVFIDHGQGLVSMSFHLNRILVQPQQRVQRGDRIGTVGDTGRVTGVHLHLGVKLRGEYVDPGSLLKLSWPDPGPTLTASKEAPARARR